MGESVQCPVCTLYLHAGMNLSDHLETHPKEQVIKALVQMTIAGNGPSSALAAAVLAGAATKTEEGDAGAAAAEKPAEVGKAVSNKTATAAKASQPPPPLSSSSSSASASASSSTNSSSVKLNNPPIKPIFEALKTAQPSPTVVAVGSKLPQFPRAATTEPLAATPTSTSSAAAGGAALYSQTLPSDYRYEQQQQQQPLQSFQQAKTQSYAGGSLPQLQHHNYLRSAPAQQQQPPSHYQQPSLKYGYANSLPPPPPLQLFTQPTTTTAAAAGHQKPPPAYGAAISQIRSQHNQNKQQQQQQHITIHQIAPPTAATTAAAATSPATSTSSIASTSSSSSSSSKQSKSSSNAHTDIFLNPPPPPASSSTSTSTANSALSATRLQQQQQQPQQQQQQQSSNLYASLLPTPAKSSSVSVGGVSSCQLRQTNSPFGALLTAAAAAACASPSSSVLRFAESPVAHYLERENGDFIVQETPKHIVECVEKEDGEFSVIERIYQSPPSVLHIHDDDEEDEEDDEDDDEREEHETEEDEAVELAEERQLEQSQDEPHRASLITTTATRKQLPRLAKQHKAKGKFGLRRSARSELDEDEFMSISSGAESSEELLSEKPTLSQVAPPPLCLAPSTSVAAALNAHVHATPLGEVHSSSNSNSNTNGSCGTLKSKKNRITVLSDVPLNMNEYLDLMGNIVASSRIGAARPFAAIAPLVKVEKEEPLDEYDEEAIRFTAQTETEPEEELEQKPSLEEQLHTSNGSSNHVTTSVIRMASNNSQLHVAEDLSQQLKLEEPVVQQPQQRFAAPNVQPRGPKKLVIKPKSSLTMTTTTTTAATKTKKTEQHSNSINPHPLSGSNSASTSRAAAEAAVQIKSECNESGSILEKHLTTSYGHSHSHSLGLGLGYGRKHDDACLLLELANSKQPPVGGATFVVNASFPSAGSVFATSGVGVSKSISEDEEYILPDNNLDVDEIVISSSSSYASQHPEPEQQLEQQAAGQAQSTTTATTNSPATTPGSFTDFNFLYQAAPAAAASSSAAGSFTPFGFQQQPPLGHTSDATNAATVASSSSSSSAASVLLDHDSMNATFRVSRQTQQQQHQSLNGGATSSWYQTQAPPHDGAQPTNFNAALAAVDCCSAAVDSDASDAKYLDLDTCKREQLSGSSNHSLGHAIDHQLPSASVSASTTSSSFAAAATESSLVGGLNIRTDEKMPAKGEISEQESNCDIDNSWSQSMYGDISPRYFRNQFTGVYSQMPDWRQDYYPAQDLSPQQREQKRFDFRLPVDMAANNSATVAEQLFDNSDAGLASASSSQQAAVAASLAKKLKRKSTSVASSSSGASTSSVENDLLVPLPTTSTSALLAGPPIASTSRAAAAAAAATRAVPKPPRRKIYKCPHCEISFEKLKERNAHMINDHNYVRQNRRLICTQAAASTAAISSTITSSSAQLLPPQQQQLMSQASSSSNAVVEDSKDGIVKIKQEHGLEQQQQKLPRDPLEAELHSTKTEELPDVKDAGLLVESPSSTADIKPHDMVMELDQKPHIAPLAMTTPAAKLAALYRMLIAYNESKLGQERSISELEQKAMEKSIFLCYVCRTDFPSVKLYDAHLTEHPAECFTCGKKFYRWKNFSLHLKRHLGWKEFGCYVCDKKFVVRSALVEHMRMHTGQTPLKCKICGKKFKRYSNLTQHRKRHTKMMVRKKEYVCHCGEVLPSKARFLWHKETHDLKPKCCPYCCDRFVHANSLRRHIRLAHSDKFDYAEPMECPMCKQIFAKTSIKAHMATHSTDPQYDCAICNKSFSTKWNLKIHSWVHANRTAKPFKCEYCPKAFVRELDFKNHMNAHKQIKPYTCEYCGCKFIRKYNYMRHRREHHGNKKFTCDQCDKSFHRHYYLIEHRRIHTGERPFQCTICGKSSTTKTNHNKHLKIHHSRDPFTVEV